jgi:hypothetical protein
MYARKQKTSTLITVTGNLLFDARVPSVYSWTSLSPSPMETRSFSLSSQESLYPRLTSGASLALVWRDPPERHLTPLSVLPRAVCWYVYSQTHTRSYKSVATLGIMPDVVAMLYLNFTLTN